MVTPLLVQRHLERVNMYRKKTFTKFKENTEYYTATNVSKRSYLRTNYSSPLPCLTALVFAAATGY